MISITLAPASGAAVTLQMAPTPSPAAIFALLAALDSAQLAALATLLLQALPVAANGAAVAPVPTGAPFVADGLVMIAQ